MASVTFDHSRYPIVVVTVDGTPSDADLERYFAGLEDLFTRPTRGILIVDSTKAALLTPAQRKRMGEWMRAHRDVMAERGLGAAFVFSSALFRFVLSSVFLIQRPPLPYIVTGSLDEAFAWADQLIRSAV